MRTDHDPNHDTQQHMRQFFTTHSHSWRDVGLARQLSRRAVKRARIQSLVLLPVLVGVRPRRVAFGRRGAARRVLRATLRVAACATRFTARQYRTTSGSALRLRIDSRTATTAATFALPAAVTARAGPRHPGRPDPGRDPGRRAPGQDRARPAAAARWGSARTRAWRAAGVRIRGRTVVVTGLPARTGIVDVTVYQPRGAARSGPARARPPGERGRDDPRAPGTKRIVARISRSGG